MIEAARADCRARVDQAFDLLLRNLAILPSPQPSSTFIIGDAQVLPMADGSEGQMPEIDGLIEVDSGAASEATDSATADVLRSAQADAEALAKAQADAAREMREWQRRSLRGPWLQLPEEVGSAGDIYFDREVVDGDIYEIPIRDLQAELNDPSQQEGAKLMGEAQAKYERHVGSNISKLVALRAGEPCPTASEPTSTITGQPDSQNQVEAK